MRQKERLGDLSGCRELCNLQPEFAVNLPSGAAEVLNYAGKRAANGIRWTRLPDGRHCGLARSFISFRIIPTSHPAGFHISPALA